MLFLQEKNIILFMQVSARNMYKLKLSRLLSARSIDKVFVLVGPEYPASCIKLELNNATNKRKENTKTKNEGTRKKYSGLGYY